MVILFCYSLWTQYIPCMVSLVLFEGHFSITIIITTIPDSDFWVPLFITDHHTSFPRFGSVWVWVILPRNHDRCFFARSCSTNGRPGQTQSSTDLPSHPAEPHNRPTNQPTTMTVPPTYTQCNSVAESEWMNGRRRRRLRQHPPRRRKIYRILKIKSEITTMTHNC